MKHGNCKFLGYFDSLNEAAKEKQRLLHFRGFSDYPDDFYLKKVALNKINWQNGFTEVVGVEEIIYLKTTLFLITAKSLKN